MMVRSPPVGRKAGMLLPSLRGSPRKPWSHAGTLEVHWTKIHITWTKMLVIHLLPSPSAPSILWAFTICFQIPMQRGVKSAAILTSYAQWTLYHNGFFCAPAVLAGNLKVALWSLQSEINLQVRGKASCLNSAIKLFNSSKLYNPK